MVRLMTSYTSGWISEKRVLAFLLLITFLSVLVPLLAFGDACRTETTHTGLVDSANLRIRVLSVQKNTPTNDRNRKFETQVDLQVVALHKDCWATLHGKSIFHPIVMIDPTVVMDLGSCFHGQVFEGESPLVQIPERTEKISSNHERAMVPGDLRPGTWHSVALKPILLSMQKLNPLAESVDTANHKDLVLIITIKEQPTFLDPMPETVQLKVLVHEIREAIQSNKNVTSLLRTVRVGQDDFQILIDWEC